MNISIIVPVYNAAEYVKRCIHSILNQTYKKFELIVINDGSTDHSLDILQELLSHKKNIKIINQTNQGVSRARNIGISHATGTYIAFIDSDDYVDSNYLEKLISATDNGNIDWVISGTSLKNEKGKIRDITMSEDVWNQQMLDSKYLYIDNLVTIHAKLYKKEIIDNYKLQFNTSMSWAEDRDFNIEFIKYIKRAHNISYVGYTYYTNIPNSLTTKVKPYLFMNDCIYWKKVLTLNNNKTFKTYVVNRLYNSIVDNINFSLSYRGLINTLQIIKNEYIKSDREFIVKNKEYIAAPKWQKYIIINNPNLFCLLIYFIKKLHG